MPGGTRNAVNTGSRRSARHDRQFAKSPKSIARLQLEPQPTVGRRRTFLLGGRPPTARKLQSPPNAAEFVRLWRRTSADRASSPQADGLLCLSRNLGRRAKCLQRNSLEPCFG